MTALSIIGAVGCAGPVERARHEAAKAQVDRIADQLDKRTADTGAYVRVKDGEIKEKDPWGTGIQVSYSQGGVAETLTVRSAGPDRQFHTTDDLTAYGVKASFKGVGAGIKKNAEETAANTAKGLVKGAVAGVKESVKDARPFKKKPEEREAKNQDAPAKAQPDREVAEERSKP
jgi:hypothetical protein